MTGAASCGPWPDPTGVGQGQMQAQASFPMAPADSDGAQAGTKQAGPTQAAGLSDLTLAGLVTARLCHDLVSPLGAIGNGVEMMQLTAAAGEQPVELGLIADSVGAARARIASFRVAFGPSGGDHRVSRVELATLLREMVAHGRLRVDLDSQGDQSRAEVKLILLALMCLETALPWGGRVLILRALPGWRLVGEATRTRPDPALWNWLGGDPFLRRPNPLPSEVQFPMLNAEARNQGRTLRWELDDTGAEIAF